MGLWCIVLTVVFIISRSLDYGASFTNIEDRLDPSNPNPVLSELFYVSDFNKNMVSGSLPWLPSLELLGLTARPQPLAGAGLKGRGIVKFIHSGCH